MQMMKVMFSGESQHYNFHLRFRTKLQGGKNDFRKIIFTQRLVGVSQIY